jgi:hypothetical protein
MTIYGEMHRYLPVIAKWNGFGKIGEKVVAHQSRKYGYTKFGLERFMNGFLDLISISFVQKFGKRPMHFFGLLGTLSFILGLFISFFLIAQKLYFIYSHQTFRNVTENPLFYFALVAIIIGSQLFMGGFLGELLIKQNATKEDFWIEKKVNITEPSA